MGCQSIIFDQEWNQPVNYDDLVIRRGGGGAELRINWRKLKGNLVGINNQWIDLTQLTTSV